MPSPALAPLLRLAWRESRTARRRLLLYMSSISLGVAALVAIDSFASNVQVSIEAQSKALLGGDLNLRTRDGFTPAIDSLLDSLGTAGIPSAKVQSFGSMAIVPRTGATRLSQVRAVGEGYPSTARCSRSRPGRGARCTTTGTPSSTPRS